MNDITVPLLGIAGAMIVGAMSPGPSFVMVARTAVSSSRGDGLAAALGMGAGGIVFAIAALVGLQAAFLAVPALYLAVKLLGGAYLVYLGVRIWRGAREPLPVAQEEGPSGSRGNGWRAFLLGMGTQVSPCAGWRARCAAPRGIWPRCAARTRCPALSASRRIWLSTAAS
jgi:threonine/homoserine/homoserine lactone efflux protein